MAAEANEELCYENNYTLVHWNERFQFMRITYKGVFIGDDFMEGGNLQIGVLHIHKGQKTLYDLRKYPVSSRSNVEWIINVFIPGMYKAGLRYLAAILPQEHYGKVAATFLLQRFITAGIEVRTFDLPHEAEAWIAHCNAQPDTEPAA